MGHGAVVGTQQKTVKTIKKFSYKYPTLAAQYAVKVGYPYWWMDVD
jgi:hypothetical protein